jgi:hypothetical protein
MRGAPILNRTWVLRRTPGAGGPIKIGRLTCPNPILRILLVPQRCAGPIPCK